MLSDKEFVRQSLELNLFFMRIAKEHSIFLEAGFTERDHPLAQQVDNHKRIFSDLLVETIRLSNGVIDQRVIASGEIVTDLTMSAERETEFYTAIQIDSNITRMDLSLQGATMGPEVTTFTRQVAFLNDKAIRAANEIARFKVSLLQDVLMCRTFTTNYPLLIDHIFREAHFYLRLLYKLQSREDINIVEEAVFQESFPLSERHQRNAAGVWDTSQ